MVGFPEMFPRESKRRETLQQRSSEVYLGKLVCNDRLGWRTITTYFESSMNERDTIGSLAFQALVTF